MSEASLRLLDQDLPRVDMYLPAFRRRVLDARREASDDAARASRKAEIALRKERRDKLRREEIARAHLLVSENERLKDERDRAFKLIDKLTASLTLKVAAMSNHQAQLASEGITDEIRIPAIDIIKDVAMKHGMTVAIIRGPSRSRSIVTARHDAMAKVHIARPDLSLPALGRIFHRDHTTLLHALRKIGAYGPPLPATRICT